MYLLLLGIISFLLSAFLFGDQFPGIRGVEYLVLQHRVLVRSFTASLHYRAFSEPSAIGHQLRLHSYRVSKVAERQKWTFIALHLLLWVLVLFKSIW